MHGYNVGCRGWFISASIQRPASSTHSIDHTPISQWRIWLLLTLSQYLRRRRNAVWRIQNNLVASLAQLTQEQQKDMPVGVIFKPALLNL
jgi:hypothetical protein